MARALLALFCVGFVAAAAIAWAERGDVIRPGAVALQLAVMGIATVWLSIVLVSDPAHLRRRSTLSIGVIAAAFATGAHGWVFGGAFTFRYAPSVSIWALAAVVAAGTGGGALAGVTAALTVTLARLLGVWAPDIWPTTFASLFSKTQTPNSWAPTFASLIGYATAGWLAARLVDWLRTAEAEISTRRAHDELSRQLHQTVLQSLVAVRLATDDPHVAQLVANADSELRRFLKGDRPTLAGLADSLNEQLAAFRRRFNLPATSAMTSDIPAYRQEVVCVVGSAVSEALTNAAKHAQATSVHLAVTRRDGGVLVSVRDDGQGFEPSRVERRGLAHTINDPLVAVGGAVEIASGLGEGTEVRLWLP